MAALLMPGCMLKFELLFALWWTDPSDPTAQLLRTEAVFLLSWAVPLTLAALLFYVLFSLPLHRRERARFFLDLVEMGLAQGRSPEQTVMEAARCGDPSPGVRFHLLAAHVEGGCRLGQALERVPRLLPPQIAAMLRVGENLGNVGGVIPACRAVLHQGLAGSIGAMHSMPLLFYLILPLPLMMCWFLPMYVLPRYRAIMTDFDVSVPFIYGLVFNHSWILTTVALVMFLLLLAYYVVYWGGPRLGVWSRSCLGLLADQIGHRIPWRHRRLQRDFVRMLALLLDAGVPEERAVRLAADATADGVMLRQAGRAADDLGRGKPLPEAMGRMDRHGEFRWRLANAMHGPRQFTRALASWGETLDAQAFQQEQVGMQVLTTGFVLLNGLLVGLVVVAVFSFMVQIIQEAVLW